MMKKISKLSILFLICLIVSGCRENTMDNPVSSSYIQVFIEANTLTLNSLNYGTNTIRIYVDGDATKWGKERYNELCEFYDDTEYNKPIVPFSTHAIANNFSEIVITSNQAFNSINAGSSLGSVADLYAASAYEYICNGYTPNFDWLYQQPVEFREGWEGVGLLSEDGFYPVLERVEGIDETKLKLIDPDVFFIRFTETPSIKEHEITITLKFGDDSLSQKVSMKFE